MCLSIQVRHTATRSISSLTPSQKLGIDYFYVTQKGACSSSFSANGCYQNLVAPNTQQHARAPSRRQSPRLEATSETFRDVSDSSYGEGLETNIETTRSGLATRRVAFSILITTITMDCPPLMRVFSNARERRSTQTWGEKNIIE
ncbi:unnamed protein product [Scytosiphon promiscuus]